MAKNLPVSNIEWTKSKRKNEKKRYGRKKEDVCVHVWSGCSLKFQFRMDNGM